MGRDAQVFKNVSNLQLPEKLKAHVVVADASTGELDFEEGWENPKYDQLIATEERLGNISMMAYLRNAIGRLCGEAVQPILYRVLENGDGSDEDAVDRDEVGALGEEISVIREKCEGQPADEDVDGFLAKLESLVLAAKAEGNGIVLS